MPVSAAMTNVELFSTGETLLWETREKGQLVRRQVAFRRLDHGRAVVAWGLTGEGEPDLFTAHLTELRRPVPPAPPVGITHPASSPPEPNASIANKRSASIVIWRITRCPATTARACK